MPEDANRSHRAIGDCAPAPGTVLGWRFASARMAVRPDLAMPVNRSDRRSTLKRVSQTLAICVAAHLPAAAADPIPPPAWQAGNASLAAQWQWLTGKYIYQRACTACHTWGPAHWAADRWADYLKSFPTNHQPDVRREYQDLTALFSAGKMVPTLNQEKDALTRFILATAPKRVSEPAGRDRPFDGFPQVGSAAPDFTIATVQGNRLSLRQLRNKKALVLVFSRAYW